MVSVNNTAFAEKISSLRNHGSQVRYHHDILGYNSRLDEIQAAILRIKLPLLDTYNEQRHQVATMYNHHLKDLPITLPYEHPEVKHVYHQYTILSEQRDHIGQHLNQAQIGNAIYYPIPLHQQNLFGDQYQAISLPHSERVAKQ